MQMRSLTIIVVGCYPNYLEICQFLRTKLLIGLLLPMRDPFWGPWHAISLGGQTFHEELSLNIPHLLTMSCINRWAAKEAAIKAHRHRRLYMQSISIVRPTVLPGPLFSTSTGGARKLIALIDPPSDRIEMTPRIARERGLRGFVPQNDGLHKKALMTREELRKDVPDLEDSEMHRGVHFYRGSRVKDSDRQVAEINISHDGEYAIAMCMAFDPPTSLVPEKTVVDQGEGLPLHEPQWGDEGWLTPDLEEAQLD